MKDVHAEPGQSRSPRNVHEWLRLLTRVIWLIGINSATTGHIACDALTNSEIVVPLIVQLGEAAEHVHQVIGVLDLDSEAAGAFDEEDQRGLEQFADILRRRVQWQ